MEQICAFCCTINCIQIIQVISICDLDEAVALFICPIPANISPAILFQLFHRAGNVEHQRDIDRLGDDLRLALAGDVGLERQIASLFIIFLMRFDAAGRAVVLRRACRNRHHGQNHNNSQQKR